MMKCALVHQLSVKRQENIVQLHNLMKRFYCKPYCISILKREIDTLLLAMWIVQAMLLSMFMHKKSPKIYSQVTREKSCLVKKASTFHCNPDQRRWNALY